MIQVRGIDETHFEVKVQASTPTTHRVHLNPEYYARLTEGRASREDLIKESFRFLLQHESNTMILSSFDLPLIQSYFPSYERDMRRHFLSD